MYSQSLCEYFGVATKKSFHQKTKFIVRIFFSNRFEWLSLAGVRLMTRSHAFDRVRTRHERVIEIENAVLLSA